MSTAKKIATCKRDSKGKVIDQNEQSLSVCGYQHGVTCQEGCVEFIKGELLERPVLRQHKLVKENFFDIFVYKEEDAVVSMLFPVAGNPENIRNTLQNAQLTKRENEISELILKGLTNQQICKKLFISRSTLKTHINRIYKKAGNPDQLFVRASAKE